MTFILILILILSIIILYLYFNQKLIKIKNQLRVTSNQLNSVLSEQRSFNSRNKNISIIFSTPKASTAITNIGANLFLAPIESSPKIKTLHTKMEVKLLDSATINSSTWFYVNTSTNNNINSRGWINQRDFSIINSYDISIISHN